MILVMKLMFYFFWIEEIMRDILTSHIKSSALLTSDGSEERKKALVESVVFDCEIQYRWYAFSSSDYIEESDSIELLTHIVSLWLTIRGFSIKLG